MKSVVVVGAGVAGLVAARELARAGFGVTVVDPAAMAGGCVATHTIDGIQLDSGAESFATRGGTVRRFLTGLGLGDAITQPDPRGAWLQLDGFAAPLPKNTLLGIPGVPLATDVRRIIGWSGALRAQLDRYLPLVRVRPETDLGEIVRRRMGSKVVDRLVAPIVSGVHSAHPDLVDVHSVAPGLTQAMTTQGSLSGAVMSMLARRGTATGAARVPAAADAAATPGASAPLPAAVKTDSAGGVPGAASIPGAAPVPGAASIPGAAYVSGAVPLPGEVGASAPSTRAGSAVGGIDGGMYRLVEALLADCRARGVDLRLGVGAAALQRVASSAVGDAPGDSGSGSGSGSGGNADAEWMTVLTDGSVIGSHGVLVAAGFRAALDLLGGIVDPETDARSFSTSLAEQARADAWPGTSAVTLATLVLDAPELDSAPRGTGVLVAEGVTSVDAKALTHFTAKWPWLAERAGAGRHVVRVSYGRGGEAARSVTLEQALADAATLLGTPLNSRQVRGFALTDWRDSLAFSTEGHRARVDGLVEAVREHPGLDVVGAWISGTGLAYVIDGAAVKASEFAAKLQSA